MAINFYKFSKKSTGIIFVSFLFSLSSFLFPLSAFSAVPSPGQLPTETDLGLPPSPVRTAGGFIEVVKGITRFAYILFFIIAVLMIILTAYTYLTASGNKENIEKAHKQLIYAAVAIAIALLAITTSALIQNFLTSPHAVPAY